MVLPRLGLQAKGAFCPEEVIGRVVLKKKKKTRASCWDDEKGRKKISCRKLAVFLRYIFAGLVLKVRVSFHLKNRMEVLVLSIVLRSIYSSGYHVVEGLVDWI